MEQQQPPAQVQQTQQEQDPWAKYHLDSKVVIPDLGVPLTIPMPRAKTPHEVMHDVLKKSGEIEKGLNIKGSARVDVITGFIKKLFGR